MPGRPLASLVPLSRDESFGSAADAFRAAAGRIATEHDALNPAALLGRMTTPDAHSANLRGRLLLMEIACPELAAPYAFYLLGAAGDLLWRGAPIRLFLFGLYRPAAARAYIAASQRLYRQTLTPANIRLWLDGGAWPE